MAKPKGYYFIRFEGDQKPSQIAYFDGTDFYSFCDEDTMDLSGVDGISFQPIDFDTDIKSAVIDRNDWFN